jgi:hypothetical protein
VQAQERTGPVVTLDAELSGLLAVFHGVARFIEHGDHGDDLTGGELN